MTTETVSFDGQWDVVIVGHGAAGLSAAVSFLETYRGTAPRVAVLDRADYEHRGGSSAWTTAGFRLDADTQLDSDWGEIVRETSGGDAVTEAYIEAFYENAVDTLTWIRQRGVPLAKAPVGLPGTRVKYGYSIEGGGRRFVDVFTELARERGATFFYEVEAVGLERTPGGPITGVRVRDAAGAEHLLSTGAVVLASGGFEGNQELLGKHIPGGQKLEPVSPGTRINNGGGIEIAAAIGAARSGQYSGAHLEPVDPRSGNIEALVNTWMVGIVVDADGNRIVDEMSTTYDMQFDYIANAVHRKANGVAYAITDAAAREALPHLSQINFTTEPGIQADTLAELAELLGIDAEGLARTVAAFNAATDTTPIDLSRLDGKSTVGLEPPKSNWAYPLAQGPFEAWPIVPQICFTFGGIRADGAARVLDEAGERIEGLYAAGEIVGTFHGTYPAGTSVLRSLTFGRIAGQQVAATASAAASVA
ncbi:FAD-dependent oxidoreductase [Nocardia harenae]|uniref:FAD-dependent oxidoreductase n=1 Tax=Nocardia harenae TaxID=358707 RepID=UPI000AF9B403|nr:FAD-dependent oxidoreductase [Nocardia harenae]